MRYKNRVLDKVGLKINDLKDQMGFFQNIISWNLSNAVWDYILFYSQVDKISDLRKYKVLLKIKVAVRVRQDVEKAHNFIFITPKGG